MSYMRLYAPFEKHTVRSGEKYSKRKREMARGRNRAKEVAK